MHVYTCTSYNTAWGAVTIMLGVCILYNYNIHRSPYFIGFTYHSITYACCLATHLTNVVDDVHVYRCMYINIYLLDVGVNQIKYGNLCIYNMYV